MEHCFLAITLIENANYKNLIGNIYLNTKSVIIKYFFKFVCIFINAVIGWHFNILNVTGQIIFPSSILSETDQ